MIQRTSRPTEIRANAIWVTVMVPVTLLLVFLVLDHARPALALLALLLFVGVSVVIPIRVLLWLALFSFSLIPFHYLGLGQPLASFSPPTLFLLAATLAATRLPARRDGLGRGGITLLLGSAFIVYTTLVSVTSPYSNTRHAVTWILLSALLLVVVPLVLSRYPGERTLLAAFDVVGAVLALMALAESVTKHNPLDGLYARSEDHLTQVWGVYRVFTTLGHPLVNGTVFAVTLTIVWSTFLSRPSWLRALVMLGLGGAVFLTASRGALLAAVVGVLCVLLVRLVARTGRPRRVGALALVVVAAAVGSMVWSSSVLGQRNASLEGEGSADFRLTLLKLTPRMLHETHFLGSGADTSFAIWHEVGGQYAAFPLENSIIQFVVDYGVLGTVLYVGFVLALVLPAVRRGAVAGPAALAAYLVAAGGFNLFEAYPTALILPCLLLTLTVMEAKVVEKPGATPLLEGDKLRRSADALPASTPAIAGSRTTNLR